jgi:glutathione synthase/RimK-type ligase-like ATP-grasp enzyme
VIASYARWSERPTEQQQCVQAAKAVGLEFAGVDLIREYAKAPNFYITEINGNPGTGIVDITGYNYFVDLVQYIETKSGQTAQHQPIRSHSKKRVNTLTSM